MIIDGNHASPSEDEFEKELDLLEQRKSPDQAISSTLYANAQIKQKVTSSIEKMKRLGRPKADSVWKIIDTLDEPLLTTAKILSTMPVTQVSVERLFSSMKFILSDHRASMKQDLFGRYFVFTSKRPIGRRNNSSRGKHEVVKDIFKFL